MKAKRAQITVFIILGLMILIAISAYIYIQKISEDSKMPSNTIDPTLLPLKQYVESCIQSVGENAISTIGRHGGYFELPEKSTLDFPTKTAYYFYLDENFMPPISTIEAELSNYVNEELFFCLRNFAEFEKQGLEVKSGKTKTETKILQNSVSFQVKLPLEIKKDETNMQIENFKANVEDVRLKAIYETIAAITKEQTKDASAICIGCIIDLSIKNDLNIDLQNLDEQTIMITITDLNSVLNDYAYKFVFANKYSEITCENIPQDLPEERRKMIQLDCLKDDLEELTI